MFAQKLTPRQVALARAIERAGIASFSQAVKALERGDNEKIAAWKAQLAKTEKELTR